MQPCFTESRLKTKKPRLFIVSRCPPVVCQYGNIIPATPVVLLVFMNPIETPSLPGGKNVCRVAHFQSSFLLSQQNSKYLWMKSDAHG